MSIIADKSIFHINSASRLVDPNINHLDDSDFVINLTFPPNNRYNRVCVLQADIPKSYYLFQSGHNTFIMHEDSQSATVTIDAGNYNRVTFMIELKKKLDAASVAMGHSWVYTVTIPEPELADDGKYTFTVAGNGGLQPSFEFGAYCYEPMGFNRNGTHVFVSDTLRSQNVVKLQREDCIYIHSDICTSMIGDNRLQEIYSNEQDFSAITYRCIDVEAYSRPLSNNKGGPFYFMLTDEFGSKIDLNGLNMNLTIIVYERSYFIERLYTMAREIFLAATGG